MKRSLMIIGTSSSCGKSFITTAFLSLLRKYGYSAAPFKAQNISLDSYKINKDYEISLSTYIQAISAGVIPEPDMNPVLIKPAYDQTQIILNGELFYVGPYTNYSSFLPEIKKKIEDSYQRLRQKHDIIIIEGAGSAAEINIEDDIPNGFTADITNSPLLLVSDIHYGGVFASIYGTMELMEENMRNNVKGFIINRYQGEKELLYKGIHFLERELSIPCAGILPYEHNLRLPKKDNLHDMAEILEKHMDKKLINSLLDVSI